MAELRDLIEKRSKLVADMRSILDASPDGVLPSDKEEHYNKIDDEQEKIGAQIDRETKLRETEKGLDAPVTRKAPINSNSTEGTKEGAEEVRAKAFKTWLRGAAINLTADEQRSLNAGLVTEGGAFIPPMQFVNDLIKAVDDKVFMRGLCRKFVVSGAGSLGFPVLDADPADADWTSELATGSLDSSMATGLRELKPTPVAKRVKVSRKLLRHSAIDPVSLIMERLAYKFAITQEKAFLTGNGATQPLGVFTASTNGIPTGRDVSTDNTATSPTVDGLLECMFSLKEQYQSTATWIFHRLCVKLLRKLKDGEGRYIWQPNQTGGTPATILERPYSMSEYAPSTFTTGLYVGILGDFSKYYIVDDIGTLEVQRLVELYAEANQDGFIGRMSSDGMPVLAEAFARVKLG